ncbi:MAG: hypothetical protein AB7K67_01060 [Hyphomicrobiaceae bacterium]
MSRSQVRHGDQESRKPIRKPAPVRFTPAQVSELESLLVAGYGAATIATIAKLPQDAVRLWLRNRAEAHAKGRPQVVEDDVRRAADGSRTAVPAPGITLPHVKSLDGDQP